MTDKQITNQLPPIIKWAGGKEKELKYILPDVPSFSNYFEPFVGGGSVYSAINTNRHYYINDKSTELVGLYKCIQDNDINFFKHSNNIVSAWNNMQDFASSHNELVEWYLSMRAGNIGTQQLTLLNKQFLKEYLPELLRIIEAFPWNRQIFIEELNKNLVRKTLRMAKIEAQKNKMPDADVFDNIETAFMSSLYMYFRSLYNDKHLLSDKKALHTALFLFIRNYAYSGMFRYNSKGLFNVPYGGIGYNHKSLEKKLQYYKSEELHQKLASTSIFNLDFEDFFKHINPGPSDFVFLDPPYDSEFSTYDRNEFTKDDQRRLANYLLNTCKAKWMLVIKSTPFILSLYTDKGLNLRSFDKKYIVSFMNRNDRKAEHLLITNY